MIFRAPNKGRRKAKKTDCSKNQDHIICKILMKITKMRKEMKRVLQEVKADVCSCRGVEDMLRSFQPFFTDDDYQRMKCLQENKGTIATWDKFIDDLMRCGDEAFEKFRGQVKEQNYFSSEFKEKFERVCFQNFLNRKGVGEHDQSFGSEDDTSSSKYAVNFYFFTDCINVGIIHA